MVMASDNPVRVLDDPSSVGSVLSPFRRKLLEELGEGDSATGVAGRLGLARQKVNYHLRELEKQGVIELAEERPRRGLTERIYRPSARAFLVDPALLGKLSEGPGTVRDRFSSAYLVATAARLIRDVAHLREAAGEAKKRLLTQTLELEARFRTPGDFQDFTDELTNELARLVDKYAASDDENGRRFRLVLGAHPARASKRQKEKNDERD